MVLGLLLTLATTGPTLAATGAGHGPSASWNEMQKFEYYLGDIAGALNVCGMYGLHSQMQSLASLTPYGKIGIQAWAVYDDIRGGVCGKFQSIAKDILKDKDKLEAYLRAKYDCSSGECVER